MSYEVYILYEHHERGFEGLTMVDKSLSTAPAKLLTECYICGSRENLSAVTGRCWVCIEQSQVSKDKG